MKYIIQIFALLSIVHSSTTYARTWTNSEGRSMEAELIRVDFDEAVFQLPNGMRTRVAIEALSDTDQNFIKKSQVAAEESKTPQATSTEKEDTPLTKWLNTRLVSRKGKNVKRFNQSKIKQADYIAFYYSASWCPPCKKFTPLLVEFYNNNRVKHDNFELVYVSSDSNETSFEAYIVDYEMPWPAIKYSDAKNKIARQFAGTGIPCLVVVDRNGNVLADSYVDGQYVGPAVVMNKLGKMLNK